MTVHKSQGMTIDAAEIDLGKPFLPGMGYVALSRVKRLDGIRLMGLNYKALQVNDEVLRLDERFQAKSTEAEEELKSMDWFEREVTRAHFIRKIKEEKEQQEKQRRKYWAQKRRENSYVL